MRFLGNEVYIFYMVINHYQNIILEKEASILIKMFTTYTQIIMLVSTFDIYWPTLISRFFSGLGSTAKASKALYSIDCLLKNMDVFSAEKTMLISLCLTSLTIIVQFILSLVLFLVAWIFKMKQIKIKILITIIVIYYLSYPQIVTDTFGLFTCTQKIDGVQYLIKNTNIVCYGSTHIKLILFVGLPYMIVFIFGVPIGTLVLLYQRRKNLDNETNLRRFGFWYIGLKRNVFYWEALLQYKKLFIITITVDIIGLGQQYQAFFIVIVLYFYFKLSANLKPYKISYLNTVSYYSEFSQVCTFGFMTIFLRQSTNSIVDNIIFVLLILIAVQFIARFAFYIGRFYYYNFKAMFLKLRERLKKGPRDEFEGNRDEDQDNDNDKDSADKAQKEKQEKRVR